jgi:type VI secretion system protein ImpL
MGAYLATAIVLILYLVLAWFAGSWLHLQAASLWLVRGGLALIGFIGAGVFLWFHRKLTRDAGEPGMGAGASVLTEIDALLNQADEKLKSAKLKAGASLRTFPIVFLLGEPNSAKTSTMLHSGLDPELLAGVVYRETETAPTNTLNIWFARGTLFIEIGGAILGDVRLWTRILNRTNTSGLASALGKGESAPRAVVVCCDAERLQAGTEKFTSTARKLAAQLQAMANALGASFPVYVLFTKLDQAPKFAEFVSNVTSEEARQILGTTVSQRDPGQGVFAEEEKNRLGKEFDQLVYSLAEKRLDYLSRENAPTKLPAIYEFPREFRKIRDQVLGFLVEMSRPTQLGTNPFLRGFYFSGVRPVMMRENIAVVPAPAASEEAVGSGATRMLSVSALAGRPAAGASPANVVRSRRVPEWTFLPYLFSEVILRDRAALGTSSQSSRTNVIRRALLAMLAIVFLCFAIAFLVSFVNNRGLQQDVMSAGKVLAATASGPVDVPSADQLKQLEQLRAILARLETNKRDGAPLSYRFGLYSGDGLYPEAQRIYFAYFFRLLLNSTERSMVAMLHQLPEKAVPDQYQDPYATLKAYLITTGFYGKSSKEFLAPALWSRWPAGNGLDPGRTELAHRQFEYYSEALITADPYSLKRDASAVEHAQGYLKQFKDSFYQILLIGARKNRPKLNFNRQYPGSGQVVMNSYELPAEFTKDGFVAMQNLLQHPEKFSGEDWVLGEKGAFNVSEAVKEELRQRYYSDFVSHWRNVLKNSFVLGYSGFPDAKRKLDQLSGQSSPLLELFWFVSQNTNVERDQIKNAFQPVQTVVPPGGPTDNPKYIQPSNQKYMDALRNLETAIMPLADNPSDQALMAQASNASAQGLAAAKSALDSANVDQDFHIELVVRDLLAAPFNHAGPLINAGPKGPLNGAGQALCVQLGTLTHFYPLSTVSNAPDLPLAQLNQVFAPDSGALWTTYNQNLKQYLVKQGSRYDAIPSTVKLNPSFVIFFNNAAAISQTLYSAGSVTPRVSFTLRQSASNVPDLTLKIGTETLSGTGQSKTFSWTGNEDVQITSKGVPLGAFSGLWAVSHFVADGYGRTVGSNELEYTIKNNDRPVIVDGKPETYSYQLQVTGVNVFNPTVWLALRCVPQVVK